MAELKRKVQLKRKGEIPSELLAPEKGSNKFLKYAIISLVPVLIGGYFLYNNSNNKTDEKINEGKIQAETEVVEKTANDSIVSPKNDSVINNNVRIVESASVAEETKIQEENSSVDSKTISNHVDTATSSGKQPYKKGEIYNVYQFPFGVAEYTQPSSELDKLVDIMKKNPDFKISVVAYTDNVGDTNYNLSLSQKRSKAIFNYLISKGIDAVRVTHRGKGVSSKYPNPDDNRRAEFVLL